MLKNPEAPASKKQLYRLHELTANDTRSWNLNMQQASSMIEGLELSQIDYNKKIVIPEGTVPFEEAKVCIIEGEQRSGKTCTGVAKIVDAYFKDCVRVYCKEVLKIKCEVKAYDFINKVAKIKYNGELKQLKIPASYKMHTPLQIFSNIHLYGIKYHRCPSFRYILRGLKSGLISYGWLLMDEAQVGINARSSMSAIGKEMEVQSFQYGKAMLNVIIITHMARLIDWTARTIPTERLSCTYDGKTKMITYSRRKKGELGTKEVSYYAPQYFKFYWTNERVNA